MGNGTAANLPAPPLDVEEALDLILACAAHTSRQEGQRKFGELLCQEYFIELRREQTDARARAYLNHLLPLIASAVRAFAVERQVFGTRWEALQAAHEERLRYADGWLGYSPLNASGVLYRLAGPGLLSAVAGALLKWYGRVGVWWIWGVVAGAAAGYILVDLVLKAFRQRVVQGLHAELPADIDAKWSESLGKYRQILENFLLLAIKVRERFYPELPPAVAASAGPLYATYDLPHVQFARQEGPREALPDAVREAVRQIVERHFVFR